MIPLPYQPPRPRDPFPGWLLPLIGAGLVIAAIVYAATHAKPSSRPVDMPQTFVGSSEQ